MIARGRDSMQGRAELLPIRFFCPHIGCTKEDTAGWVTSGSNCHMCGMQTCIWETKSGVTGGRYCSSQGTHEKEATTTQPQHLAQRRGGPWQAELVIKENKQVNEIKSK